MRNQVLVFITSFVLVVSSNNALAGRQWYYQHVVDSMNNPIGAGNTAIGMRSYATWPVVITNEGSAAMVPGGWVRTAGGVLMEGRIDADTSVNGSNNIIFADSAGKVAIFGYSGWSYRTNNVSTVGFNNQSAAFTQNNNPAVLYRSAENNQLALSIRNGSTWSSSSTGKEAESFALDYDNYNQANVALSQGGSLVYGTKGVLTDNQWSFSQPITMQGFVGGPIDLQLTFEDIPYIAYMDAANYLSCATYDRMQGVWTTSTIDYMTSNIFCMASDYHNGIGIAYLTMGDDGTTLGYAYNDGRGQWTTEHLWDISLVGLLAGKSISLTFDIENNPVISFSTGNGIWIAYDPVIIPEPATMALLLLGGVFSLRLRKP
jgi:hypothetical protein